MFGFFKGTPSISTKELAEKLKDKNKLIDVRSRDEYRVGHIPRAENIELNKIANYKGKTDQPIYVICQSGARSSQAVRILQQKGYQAINVRGGMNQWNGPVKGGKWA